MIDLSTITSLHPHSAAPSYVVRPLKLNANDIKCEDGDFLPRPSYANSRMQETKSEQDDVEELHDRTRQ